MWLWLNMFTVVMLLWGARTSKLRVPTLIYFYHLRDHKVSPSTPRYKSHDHIHVTNFIPELSLRTNIRMISVPHSGGLLSTFISCGYVKCQMHLPIWLETRILIIANKGLEALMRSTTDHDSLHVCHTSMKDMASSEAFCSPWRSGLCYMLGSTFCRAMSAFQGAVYSTHACFMASLRSSSEIDVLH